MALSEDQKAMLRLLAQREQGYNDIAALTGSSVEEVRGKVKDAVAGLDQGLGPDQKAMLRLLAQREQGYDDIAALTGSSVEQVRGKVNEALAGLDDEAPTVTEDVAKDAEPAAAAPTHAPEPKPTPPPKPPPPAKAPPKPPKSAAKKSPSKPGLPEDKSAVRALIAGGAVVLVIILLLVTGVLGDGDGDSGSDATTSTPTTAEGESGESGTPTANGKEPTQAVLEAVDGSDATGQALFGRSGKSVVLLLSAKGLQASPNDQSYTVSLVRSPTQRLPLVATKAGKAGVIAGRFQVEPQVLNLLAGGFDQMEISLVADSALKVALAEAKQKKQAPDYEGTTVLEGPVTGPIVEAGEAG